MTKPAGDSRVVIEHPVDGRAYEVSRDAFKDIYAEQGFEITHNADMTIAPEVIEARAKAEKAEAAERDAKSGAGKKSAHTIAIRQPNGATGAAQPASVTITTDGNGTGQSAPQG